MRENVRWPREAWIPLAAGIFWLWRAPEHGFVGFLFSYWVSVLFDDPRQLLRRPLSFWVSMSSFGGFFGRHRLADIVTLCDVTLEAAQIIELLPGLNTLGDNAQLHASRHRNDCSNQGGVGLITRDVLDKRAVYF